MQSTIRRGVLGVAIAVALPMSTLFAADEGAKVLPTLLIKGEIVSLDANDPTATLLKVKDRYGFETPIFVTQDTKVSKADAAVPVNTLATGTPVEVEYNFDINTAKRHAVSVKVAVPTQAAAAPTSPTATSTSPASPEASTTAQPTPQAPAVSTPPSQEEAAPSAQ
jgi:hypothetical protein